MKDPGLSHFTAHTEMIPMRCSLCQDYMHLRCVKSIPMHLILSGGMYHSKSPCTRESIEAKKALAEKIEAEVQKGKSPA